MKFKLYSLSALAIAALMTACSTDDEIVQNPVATAEVATPTISVNLDELATRGFASEKGAWTNFKANANEVGANYDARVTLMVYATNNGVEATATPIAIAPAKYMTQEEAAESGDQIKFESLRVPAGASYTAVAYVDFVGKDHADKFYNVANLANVEQILDAVVDNGSSDAEMRDAYTGQVTFTLTSDGTLSNATVDATQVANPDGTSKPEELEAVTENIEGATANVTTLNILARRHFAKVRIILTDYQTKAQWNQYFAGEDATRAWNAEAMRVNDLSTKFNALAQEPIAASEMTDNVFVSEYDYQAPTINWVQPQVDGVAATVDNLEEVLSTKGMRGVSVDLADVADDAVVFPVLGYNYFIPANTTDAAVYNMDFAALSKQAEADFEWSDIVTEEPSEAAWKTLMVRHIYSVPVVKNTLTTIWGNFLTVETPMFLVTINDVFDNEIDRVLLADDSQTKTIITIADVLVEIYRDADGNILKVDVDKDEDNITAENYDTLVKGLQDLVTWTEDSKLNIYFNGYLKDNDDIIAGHEIDYIHLIAEGTLANPYTNTAFTDNVWITSDFDQPAITIATEDNIRVNGDGKYESLDLTADKKIWLADFTSGDVTTNAQETISKDINVEGNLNVTGDLDESLSDITGDVNVDGNAAFASTTVGGDTNVTGNATSGTSEFGGDVTIGGTFDSLSDDIAGDLTVGGNADLQDTEVDGKTQFNGEENEITGGEFGDTVTSEGKLTVDGDAFFHETVTVKGEFLANGGTFDNSIHCYDNATFNAPAYVNWSSDNRRYIFMEGNGTTITLNTNAGNVSCGDNIPTAANGGKIYVTGSEAGEGKTYYNIEAADTRFEIVD